MLIGKMAGKGCVITFSLHMEQQRHRRLNFKWDLSLILMGAYTPLEIQSTEIVSRRS